jgi:2-dehydro-3-deoxyphosphogluconate aldolase/(4S)-4-hydroxy-2-oxoglutarate aldolase
MSHKLIEVLARQKTMPTLLPDQVAQTLDDIAIYRAAGHGAVEILMRTPLALDAVRAARRAHPDMLIGAGTVLTPGQVDQALEAGAQFIVSPAIDPVVAAAVKRHGLDFIPGVCTPTDVAVALREGFSLLKLFPVQLPALERLLPESTEYLEALASPFGHTPLRVIAAYGVSKANFAAYLSHRLVGGVIAGWLHNLHGDILRQELDETLRLARLPARSVA